MVEREKSKSRTKLAYDLLRQDILNGTLAPESKLMINELKSRYDLGMMPLREALNRLSAEMLVDKHEQRGFSVPSLNIDAYLEIQNARIAIESQALLQSIEAQRPGWESNLLAASRHLEMAASTTRSDDGAFLLTETWNAAHHAFHRGLIVGCDNLWLLTFADKLYEQTTRYRALRRHISTLKRPARATLIEEHYEIMDAALARDADAAIDRLIDHYRLSVEIVLGKPVVRSTASLRLSVANNTDAAQIAKSRSAVEIIHPSDSVRAKSLEPKRGVP